MIYTIFNTTFTRVLRVFYTCTCTPKKHHFYTYGWILFYFPFLLLLFLLSSRLNTCIVTLHLLIKNDQIYYCSVIFLLSQFFLSCCRNVSYAQKREFNENITTHLLHTINSMIKAFSKKGSTGKCLNY